MSQYKSAIRSQPQQEPGENTKYREQARQLQEAFPRWSNDDLQILLNEVNGDIQLAATRLSDGTVEQWGEVSRKKDKKPAVSNHPSKTPTSARGDSRGGRGGRSGRGGPGRGGAVRGRGGPPRGNANGHVPRTDAPRSSEATNGVPSSSPEAVSDEVAKPESHDKPNGVPSLSLAPAAQVENAPLATSTPAAVSSSGGVPSTSKDLNGSALHPPVASKQASKLPATSKLSWAQIARPHEKPTVAPPQHQPLAPPAPPANPPSLPPPIPEAEHPVEPQEHVWEEPTTVEAPTWDDDPQTERAAIAEPWPPSTETPTETLKPETPEGSTHVDVKSEVVEEAVPTSEIPVEAKVDAKAISPPTAAQATPALASPPATATPSPKLTARPAVPPHRSSARYKITDQPVTMPLSFGSGIEKVGMQFGSLSLAGDGSVTVQPEPELPAPSSSEPPSATPPFSQVKLPQPEPSAAPSAPPATAPASSTSLASVFQQQQQQQQQPQALPPPQTSAPHHAIPTSISQPAPPTQNSASHTAPINSPLQPFAQQQNTTQQQQSLVNNTTTHQPPQQQHQAPPNLHQQTQPTQVQPQHLQHLPQQLQQNHSSHHSYTQHGLPTHIDPAQSTQVQQQPLQNNNHSNYFRHTEGGSSPYFHAPTPPATQAQDNAYGSFGQLGGQAQHQQGSHLGGFASSDYGYSENSRFYESYAQTGFGGRNPLSHDDIKGIPGSQQPTNAAIPPSAAQAPQQHAAQATNQPQSASGQGPQQNYPPPVPYYYTHAYPQNQYYGSPYSSGYGVPQPFVKYPAMFQPGPPGPGSGANPTAKQPAGNVGVGVQPQTNPYNPAIYQQGGYDDYQPHPHHSQHQHQHTHSLGLSQGAVGSGEYGKQLYGGGAQGGMQGFMGLGGQSGNGGPGPTSNAGPRNAASPEAAYKPYAAKDVASATNRGVPVQQGGQSQGQPQGQGQGPAGQGGPQGQGFYGGNRFGSGVGAGNSGGVGGGPQQGGHHQQQGGPHLGYPQGGNEPFYGYQPRQQQGYWQ